MKGITLSILILLSQITLKAQNESDYFLWKVHINGSEFTLAGSLHAGKPELFPFPDAYMDAYREADMVIFELEGDSKTLESQIFDYAAKDSLDESQHLDQFLSDESRKTLDLLFQGKEDMLARYYGYEGWLMNMAISGRRSVFLGYDPELAVDMYFHDLAVKDNKMIIGLDELETQLQLFDFDVPLENQVKILESAIRVAEQQALADQALFDTYFSFNQKRFEEAFLATMDLENPQVKAVYNRVFVSRNKAWVDKLIELSEKQPGSYFMLVGSGHYFGPENIRELLEAKGLHVKPYLGMNL